jgi:hypothetical protein
MACYIHVMSLLRRYVQCTCLFGLVHAIPHVWTYQTFMYTSGRKREMMLVDKCLLVFANTVSAPVLWPLQLRRDLIRLECLVRGEPVSDYLPEGKDL